MRINGECYLCDDDVVRPVIRGEVLNANGFWEPVLFLVDTGADRTVLSAAIFDVLGFQPIERAKNIGGVGGVVESVVIKTKVRFDRDDGNKVLFRGEYAAFTELEVQDISVLGRDILQFFALIFDQRAGVVCLLSQRHRYLIEEND